MMLKWYGTSFISLCSHTYRVIHRANGFSAFQFQSKCPCLNNLNNAFRPAAVGHFDVLRFAYDPWRASDPVRKCIKFDERVWLSHAPLSSSPLCWWFKSWCMWEEPGQPCRIHTYAVYTPIGGKGRCHTSCDFQDHSIQARKSAGEISTLNLKPMRKDTRSPKQEQSVAPQNRPWFPKKNFKKKFDEFLKVDWPWQLRVKAKAVPICIAIPNPSVNELTTPEVIVRIDAPVETAKNWKRPGNS